MNVLDALRELGVSIETSDQEIEKAYRRRAAECHPDRHPDDPSPERFMRVRAAYDLILTDERLRMARGFPELLEVPATEWMRDGPLTFYRRIFHLEGDIRVTDPFCVLGIGPRASDDEVEQAYRLK